MWHREDGSLILVAVRPRNDERDRGKQEDAASQDSDEDVLPHATDARFQSGQSLRARR